MTAPLGAVEWAVAGRPLRGEAVSGDRHVLLRSGAWALAGVIDGAGHGREAAVAAERAQATLASALGRPVDELFARCHAELRGTRGAAMSLAWLDLERSQVSWAGVGNVEAALARPGGSREILLLRGGVVGFQMRPPRVSSLPMAAGDVLIFATDGLRPDFLTGVALDDEPRRIADDILERHAKGTDDALTLVVRRA